MFQNDKQKMLGILLAGKSLGSTRNEMHPGMQYGGFSCLPTLADFGHIYFLPKYNLSKCPNENKFKIHWILSLEESKINKSTQHLQCPLKLRPKEHGSFRNHGKKGTNGSSLMKRKTKCFASFAGNLRMEKTRNISWQYSLTIETNNFQTDSLKAHKAN